MTHAAAAPIGVRVAWQLEQQDLWLYGPASGDSLAFVRTLIDGADRVVLVFDPADNPGHSPINAAEAVLDEIESAFGPTPTFVFFPALDDDEWIELARSAGTVEFTRHESATITARLGPAAQPPAAEACRCADLAPGHLLLERVRPEAEESNIYEMLAVVDVAALPWPHNPGRCAYLDRFLELELSYPSDAAAVAGAHWFVSLDPADTACPAHRADWSAAAGAAVAVLEAGTARERDALLNALTATNPPPETVRAAASFFTQPIAWVPGSSTVINGQHRACALKLAGVQRCVVDVDGQEPAREPRSARQRALDEIAAHWQARATAAPHEQ